MKSINLLIALGLLVILSTSCNKDKDESEPTTTETITNMYAPGDLRNQMTGEIIEERPYVYFDISSGSVVTVSDAWDIAIKGTTFAVNSGTSGTGSSLGTIVANTFDGVTSAPADSDFSSDNAPTFAIPGGSGNGWYTYAGPPTHTISPIAGRVILIKTEEGNYAKMEILSYYNSNPSDPDTPEQDYFTFNYAYQADGTRNF